MAASTHDWRVGARSIGCLVIVAMGSAVATIAGAEEGSAPLPATVNATATLAPPAPLTRDPAAASEADTGATSEADTAAPIGSQPAMMSRPRAVAGPALLVDLPRYGYGVSSQGGWLDRPRTKSHTLSGSFAGTTPLGDRFGMRLYVGGGASRSVSDPNDSVSSRDLVGDVTTGLSGFWRDPDRLQLGLGYSIGFGFSSFTTEERDQSVGLFGALFVGNFDLDARISYGHSFQKTELDFGAPAIPPLVSKSNSVGASLGATWYPAAWCSVALAGNYTYARSNDETPLGDLGMKFSGGGVALAGSVLPPTGIRRWMAIDFSISYGRYRSRLTTPAPPLLTFDESASNSYGIGAGIRFAWPGVTSLAELRRHY